MRKTLSILICLAYVASAPAVLADERTVRFDIENMSCASCPYIVERSMSAVPGVGEVEVSFDAKTATVTFEDTRTNPKAIAGASTNAGYPARLAEPER